MIVNERIISYIQSLDTDRREPLDSIENNARQQNIPIIRREMKNVLRVLLALTAPKEILEIGTAVGYSAILMSEYTAPDCHITTIENYPPHIAMAKDNIRLAGREDRIRLLEGDAGLLLSELPCAAYDFIFMDAAKGQYPHYLKESLRLMHTGSVLVADNVLQDGETIDSRYAVPRRNRTIHSRIREYMYEVTHNAKLVTAVIPIGDGITVSVMQDGADK